MSGDYNPRHGGRRSVGYRVGYGFGVAVFVIVAAGILALIVRGIGLLLGVWA